MRIAVTGPGTVFGIGIVVDHAGIDMQLPGDVVVGRHIDAEALEIGVGSLPPAVELVETDAKRPLLEFMGDADVVARGEALLQKIAEIVLVGDERRRNPLPRLGVDRAVVLYGLEITARRGGVLLVEFRAPGPQTVVYAAALAVEVGILAEIARTVDALLLGQGEVPGGEHRRGVERDLGLLADVVACLGSNQDRTVGAARTVKHGRLRTFQDRDRFDVVRRHAAVIGHGRSVDDVDRGLAAQLDRRIFQNAGAGVDRKSGNLAVQGVDRIIGLHLVESVGVDLLERISQALLGFLDAEGRDHDRFQRDVRRFETDVHTGLHADMRPLGLVADITERDGRPDRDADAVVAVGIGDASVGGSLLDDRDADERHALFIGNTPRQGHRPGIGAGGGSGRPRRGLSDDDMAALDGIGQRSARQCQIHHLLDRGVGDFHRNTDVRHILVLVIEQIVAGGFYLTEKLHERHLLSGIHGDFPFLGVNDRRAQQQHAHDRTAQDGAQAACLLKKCVGKVWFHCFRVGSLKVLVRCRNRGIGPKQNGIRSGGSRKNRKGEDRDLVSS